MNMDHEYLSHQLNRYKYIIENIRDVIWELNKDLEFTFISPNSKQMTGYEAEEMVGRKIPDLLVEESRNYLFKQIRERTQKRLRGEIVNDISHDVQFICKDGSIKWVQVTANLVIEDGMFLGYIGTTRDISEKKEYEHQLNRYIEELKILNAQLEKMATVDLLTGAYNRRKFEDELDLIIKMRGRQNINFSLILFDIDHFKMVNDFYGHKIGDFVLQSISKLVSKNIRSTDRLFRWGGEEFVLILPETDLEDARIVAEKLREIIHDENFGINRKISISLGVGEYKEDENADQIVSRIDRILYQAKILGRNRVAS